MRARLYFLFLWLGLTSSAFGQICGAYPYTLTNGTTADANQVMGDFDHVRNCVNNMTSFLRGQLFGLTMANNVSTPNTVIDTSAGVANSDDFMTLMSLAAFSKSANTGWAVGSGNGCLQSGQTWTANTWYHLYVIARTDTGVVDLLCSTSATAPTLPSPYTKKRRIGAFKTNASSQILAFRQMGDEFIWVTPVQDVNVSNLSTTPITYQLGSVPAGLQVNALIRGIMFHASSAVSGLVFSTEDTSTTANNPAGNVNMFSAGANTGGAFSLSVRTSATQQIKAAANTSSTSLLVVTYGWIDPRGRLQ